VCKSSSTSLAFKKYYFDEWWDIYDCKECGLRFLDFRGRDKQSLDKAYDRLFADDDYYKAILNDPDANRAQWQTQFNIIRQLFEDDGTRKKRILDIGCNAGHFLDNVPNCFEKHGIESYEPAARVAKQKGIKVYTEDIKVLNFPNEYFDAVTMFALIEHLLDPVAIVEKCNRMLVKGGMFVVMTGDAESLKARIKGREWHMYCPPIHQFFFSAKSLDRMIEGGGFKKVKKVYTDGGMAYFRNPYANYLLCKAKDFISGTPWLQGLPLFDHNYSYYRKR
jgi:2-polyprenyl-3-methyl-5-hydroxy-6-metoxy-1,4-benzoquinol methylase